MKHLLAALVVAWALGSVPALAQTAAPTPSPSGSPSPSPSPSATPRPWQASGYAAASYTSSGTQSFTFTNGTPTRVFDYYANSPMLNAVNVQLQKNGTFGGKLEILAGQTADVIASYPMNNNPNQHWRGIDPVQAYLSYTAGTLTLIAGKFETLAGAEVIEDPSDANVSRSILFGYAVPFTHTGARLSWSPSSLFTVNAGVNNGWDNLKGPGAGQSRTLEAGVAYNGPVVQVTAQTYQGTERISDALWSTPLGSPTGHRSLVDVVATYKVTPAVSIVANYDSGSQANAGTLDAFGNVTNPVATATWNGVAAYVNWTLNPMWAASLRAETFRDNGGYRTGFDQTWNELTTTVGYNATSAVTLRAEGRWDRTTGPLFYGPTASYGTYALQALLKF